MPDVSLLQREYYGGEEEESAIPGIVSTAALILFLVSAAAFAGLYMYNRFLITRAQTITENIKGLRVGDVADTIDQLKALGDKAKNLKELREAHTSVSGFLAMLEKTTHPAVAFSSAEIDAVKNTAKVKGIAHTAKAVARQVEIYQKEGEVSDFSVENIGYGTDQSVLFQATITFKK